jgi:hypothetical protein
MAKAKKPATAQGLQRSAEKLRKTAKQARLGKNFIADAFVEGFAKSGMIQSDMCLKALEIYTHAFRATRTIFAEVEKNPKFRAQIETLVANIVEDVAARINEFANVLESVSKSEDVVQAFDDATIAIAGLLEQYSSLRRGLRSVGKKKSRRGLSVVKDDSPASTEEPKPSKSAKGRKGPAH